jgi:hypothetical protein
MSNVTEYQYEIIQQFLLRLYNSLDGIVVEKEFKIIQDFVLGIHTLVDVERSTKKPVTLSVSKILSDKEASFARKANRLMPKKDYR